MTSEETTCRVLKRLSEEPDPRIRGAVARNENIPDACGCEILSKLSRDESDGVRQDVSMNPSQFTCMCDIFTQLSRDKDWDVRRELSLNKYIPKECACEIFNNLLNKASDTPNAWRDEDNYMRDHLKVNSVFDKCWDTPPAKPKYAGIIKMHTLSRQVHRNETSNSPYDIFAYGVGGGD